MMRGSLARDQRVVTMNPVLIQEIQPGSQNDERDEDDNDQSLHSVRHPRRIKHAESSDVGLPTTKVGIKI